MASPVKACVAEAIGTFALCFIGGGAICMTTLQGSDGAGLLGVAIAHGLILSIAVSATMNVSGGHLNPAVTVVMLITKRIGGAEKRSRGRLGKNHRLRTYQSRLFVTAKETEAKHFEEARVGKSDVFNNNRLAFSCHEDVVEPRLEPGTEFNFGERLLHGGSKEPGGNRVPFP